MSAVAELTREWAFGWGWGSGARALYHERHRALRALRRSQTTTGEEPEITRGQVEMVVRNTMARPWPAHLVVVSVGFPRLVKRLFLQPVDPKRRFP